MNKANEKKLHTILLVSIVLLLIAPLVNIFSIIHNQEKKMVIVSPHIAKEIDSILIVENFDDAVVKTEYIKKENFWFLKVGQSELIPLNNQFNSFFEALQTVRSGKLITKKIKNWEQYGLLNAKNEVRFFTKGQEIFKLYLGIANEDRKEIYFRFERASVYRVENFFSAILAAKIIDVIDTKWLPTYLSLSRKSIQRIRIQSDFETEYQKNYDNTHKDFSSILERILGSSGALILDISSIKNTKPILTIKIENDNTKEYSIAIYDYTESENTNQKNSINSETEITNENAVEKMGSYLVIPPNASYGLEISQWSIDQIIARSQSLF